MKKSFIFVLFTLFLFSVPTIAQTWQGVGGGTSGSSHGLLTYNGKLIDLGSFNNVPCDRVAAWDGSSWSCLGSVVVGVVARAGVVWNGKLVVVGDFWNNFQPCAGCNGIAVWDGFTWTPLDQGFNNDVLTCTIYNGDLIIGGDFTEANGVPISRVARWNTTTSTFESMGTPASFDNDVRCMVEFDGELYVGGDFSNVDGNAPSDGLVKWDAGTQTWIGGNSGVDLVGGVNETIRVLYVNPNDGNLYMGGHFTALQDGDSLTPDANMRGVAMYDGSNWFPLGTGLNDYCRAIHEYNGNLIVGGYFTTANGVACNKIAKWIPSAQTFSPMGLGFDATGIDEYVKSATVWNGIFFAGGAYTQAEGNPMNYISQWYEVPTSSPTAFFTASSTIECEGGCVNFADNSTNTPTSWTWTFPGSSMPSSTSQNPLNICYPTFGTYLAKLVACNSNGCDSTTVNITINGASIANPLALLGCDSLLYNSNMYYATTMVNDTSFGGAMSGCDSITNQQITINNSVVTNQTPIISCDSAMINGVWYFTSQTVSDYYAGGTYNGCDSTDVTLLTINNSVVTNQTPIISCDSAMINGIWYFTSQTVSDYYAGGTYKGCDSTDVTLLTINSVDVSTNTITNIITANATSASYQWLDCNNGYAIIFGETAQSFIVSMNGSYAVEITQNGCTDTSACENIIISGFNYLDRNKGLVIYPIPSKNKINLISKLNKGTIEIIDIIGKPIKSYTSILKSVDISELSSGIYFLKIITEKGTITGKFIKQ